MSSNYANQLSGLMDGQDMTALGKTAANVDAILKAMPMKEERKFMVMQILKKQHLKHSLKAL